MSKKNKNKGFTIIEMLVAVFIFSIVMLISVGALMSLIDANRKARTLQAVTSEINFVMETMLRELRLGTKYYCGYVYNSGLDLASSGQLGGNDCSTAGNRIGFLSQDGEVVTYYHESVGTGANAFGRIMRAVGSNSSAMTGDRINITQFDIRVIGATDNRDDGQPLATFVVEGETRFERDELESAFSLQTSATPRKYDDDEI